MRILSWNVNGIRACVKHGFTGWLESCGADVVGIQEVRATLEQLPPEVRTLSGWSFQLSAASRLGYSGVGLFSRRAPDEVETSLGNPAFDLEGRLVLARFGRLWVASVYFPNGSGKARDNSRIPYKLGFYQALFNRLEPAMRAGEPLLIMGDFNTAHQEIDLARPKANQLTSGFTVEEREELTRWLQAGWVDTFRRQEPAGGHYTWWSSRFGVREKNVGWRIDYILASPGALPFVERAFILPEVKGSDHCPVGVELSEGVCLGEGA